MMTIDEREARALLRDERERLHQIRAALGGDAMEGRSDETPEAPAAGEGSEAVELERDRSILEHVDAQLEGVDRAMERLDLGTYGLCDACGRPIGEDRLRARPAAGLCIDDQARADRAAP
jgi:DnaK suppressor protein